ncbi:RagB/SusD family nutrient uptake outer membrane protein [Hymenobacter rubidus]|uniref:RagB/SusD family nutrient uptake outer membrane protein n=1 Tax=Hymenobacter rubidus TaxID=1441626 RepID=UPI00191ED048|nr:RagB/SusD family nutrient uptake outer membrane protein [Hymenobacter rubidus]
MKSLYLFGAALVSALALSSCEKALDKMNLSATEGTLIFKDSTLANLNLNYIYDQNLPGWAGQGNLGGSTLTSLNPNGLSDESFSDNAYMQGIVQLSDVVEFGTVLSATNNYGKIRTINMFIRDVRAGSLPSGTKNRLIGQAQFFRAWRYFDLVRIYGGVPLVMSPLNGVGTEARNLTYLPRNTTTECFRAIAADLDSAAAVLPGKWAATADWGHITKGAALAFKGRALLFAASPEFSTDNTAKWQAAYDASLAAKNALTASGFGLHASYDQLWFQETSNPEAVMITGYNNSTGDQTKKNNSYDNATRPSYTGTGGGSNQPTWEMVQAYPMLDGKMRGASTKYPYTDQLYYKNRDPRFDKTIAYNGCTWPLNGNTAYKLWTYYKGTTSVETKASSTSFYCRKAISPTAAVSDVQYLGTDWIEIRYAEVLLNLAEAACGINDLPTAYAQLVAIRRRAGLEPGADNLYGLQAGMSRTQMFDAILFERQIEFAFEGKRFWDLRRWKKLSTVFNALTAKRRHGLTITLSTTAPADFATTRDNLVLDNVYTSYFPFPANIVVKNVDTKYDLNWKPEYDFFAIPQQAIDNNPSILQNNTWSGGSFDPLQ